MSTRPSLLPKPSNRREVDLAGTSSVRFGGARRACRPVKVCAAKRRPKNPNDFADYDDIRASLQEEGAGGFSGFLNWLSAEGFGGQTNKDPLAQLYGSIMNSPLLKSLDKSHLSSGALEFDGPQEKSDLIESDIENSPKAEELAMLLVCSKGAISRMVMGYPEMLEMPSSEILQRLIRLRELLPGCDVPRMVELAPKLFLDADQEGVEASVANNFSLLRSGLIGADVEKMVQEDPGLLFWDLSGCVERLYDLWDVDEETLKNCSAKELALAMRALSKKGPPCRF
ncbi:hypothetical protein BSKO_13144 [Bryopsis sp. KO-2023]|nr:hypothetical protein BSKO_13144 [Bryopsis sp. KO-2023]